MPEWTFRARLLQRRKCTCLMGTIVVYLKVIMGTIMNTALEEPKVIDARREELLRRYNEVRKTSQWICEPLTVEDCVVQTAIVCSPVKWQLAHVTWFFEQFILEQFDPSY